MSSETANELSEQTGTLASRFETRLEQFSEWNELFGAPNVRWRLGYVSSSQGLSSSEDVTMFANRRID